MRLNRKHSILFLMPGNILDHVNEINGNQFGDYDAYERLELIGTGGFSSVYKVRRKSDGDLFAMKVPKDIDFVDSEATISGGEFDDFKREAEVWARLSFDAQGEVVQLVDYNIVPFPWIVMELADKSFDACIKDRSAKVSDVLEMLHSLERIHSCRVIHRDIKPANILYVDGRWKFSDFGLSRSIKNKLVSGQIKGTPEYMAPEQISKKMFGEHDSRTDLWQMSMVFYNVLTDHKPYDSDDLFELGQEIMNDGPDLSVVDNRYYSVLSKAFNPCKEDRYQTAQELLSALNMCSGPVNNATIKSYLDLVTDLTGTLDHSNKNNFKFALLNDYSVSDKELFEAIKEYADNQESHALYDLSLCYECAIGIEQDYRKALEYCMKAANLDNDEACFHLGYVLYQKKLLSNKDALSYAKKAVALNNKYAAAGVAMFYLSGDGVKQSYREGARWLDIGVERRDPTASKMLAYFYLQGYGVPKDINKSLDLFKKADECGDKGAASILACLYFNDKYTRHSHSESLIWARKSADYGYGQSMLILGLLYAFGDGVAHSASESKYWLQKYSEIDTSGVAQTAMSMTDQIENFPPTIRDEFIKNNLMNLFNSLGLSFSYLPFPPPSDSNDLNIVVDKTQDRINERRNTILYDSNGSKYMGDVVRGKPDGYGVIKYPNGNTYEGNWKNGEIYGEGVFTWNDGDSFSGIFSEGKMSSLGKYMWGPHSKYSGCTLEAYWSDNKMISKKSFFNSNGKKKLFIPKDLVFHDSLK